MTAIPSQGNTAAALPGGEDISSLTFEQAREALNEVVNSLEGGGTTLERSLALWERGEALADHCQSWLDGARRRIEEVRQTHATEPAAE